MKLRTSFFNGTIFRKDLTRFYPVWAVYLVFGLILSCSNLQFDYHQQAKYWINFLPFMSALLCVYALLVSQLLFGELFQGRLCYAIHALPVRREGLFFSHFTAGLVIGIGPNALLSLVAMLGMGQLWPVGLLWLAATALIYVAFFGMAVFSMHCAGNRFAAVAIYGLINSLAALIFMFFESFYLPMLHGVQISSVAQDWVELFTPVIGLSSRGGWVEILHAPGCKNFHYSSYRGDLGNCVYQIESLGAIWIYAGILAALGLLFSGAALLIYRKRQLEDAGDFVSFKPIGFVFTLLASVAMGSLCYYVAMQDYAGLFIGLVLGFFICRMLLERSVKVFGKRNWVKLVALLAAVALSLGLTWVDASGITRIVPDLADVESVTLADGYLSQNRLEKLNTENPASEYGKNGMMTLTKPEQIQDIMQVHRLMIRDKSDSISNTQRYTIHYVLKNGKTLTRYYYIPQDSEAMQLLERFINSGRFVLGFDTAQQLTEHLRMVYIYDPDEQEKLEFVVWYEKLAEALFADAEEGNLGDTGNGVVFSLELEFTKGNGVYTGQWLSITKSAQHTIQWLAEYRRWLGE